MRLAARLVLGALALTPVAAHAQPMLLSANDGLQTFADGLYKMRPHPGLGTLSAFDVSALPPRPLWSIPLEQTAIGPPIAISATPDGHLVLIGNPAVPDPTDANKIKPTDDLQVVHISGTAPPAAPDHVPLKHHPWGVAVAPDGHLGATANGDGTLTLLRIAGGSVTPIGDVAVGTSASINTGVAFSPDGRYLLASRRHDDLVSLFRVSGETLTPVRDVTVGSNPYEVAVGAKGTLAAVSNVGRTSGDHDSVSLIDLSADPVRTVNVVSVGPTPEGIALSADAHWLAVNSISGSNMKPDNPFHGTHSLIQLFEIGAGGAARLAGTAEVGINAQGLAFTPDGTALIAQDYATDSLAVFTVGPQGLTATGSALPVEGGPSALAVIDVKP